MLAIKKNQVTNIKKPSFYTVEKKKKQQMKDGQNYHRVDEPEDF
jgi:hypothetical protein